MVRRAGALLTLAILSGVLLQTAVEAQEARTHTVTRGETLWDLARRYYDNPFEWRRIYEANGDVVEDPHWIYPGEVLTIPGIAPVEVSAMEVRQGEAPAPSGLCPATDDRTVFFEGQGGAAAPCPLQPPEDRTIFFETGAGTIRGGILAAEERPWMTVPRDIFYATPWLLSSGEGELPAHLATITEFRQEGSAISTRTTARPYERVRLKMRGASRPEEGALLQSFRVTRTIEAGQVVKPSGLLTVTERTDSGVVAVVSNEYARVQLGDMVRIAPAFDLEPGFGVEPLEGGPRGRVIGFERDQEIYSLGDYGFVSLGASDGLRVGDELEVLTQVAEGWSPPVAGRLHVVVVQDDRASFRIVEVISPAIREGTVVRVSGRLP